MPVQITILGFDQIGVSFGLALSEKKNEIQRVGYDPDPERTKQVDTDGAFDRVSHQLSDSVRDADVVLISLPNDQIETTLKELAQHIKAGAVIIDTCRLCKVAAEWADSTLPDNSRFISMIPTLNGFYLHENPSEYTPAHPDLFRNSEMVIATRDKTHKTAINAASNLTKMVGSHPFITDLPEADGLHTRIDLLAKLASAALLLATIEQAGWNDSKRLTSTSFRMSTEAIQQFDEMEHPSISLLANKQDILTSLDVLSNSVNLLRNFIESGDQKSLDVLLSTLKKDHKMWVEQRSDGNWDKEPEDENKQGHWKKFLGDFSLFKKK
jgi:prephenate dehydrogenase